MSEHRRPNGKLAQGYFCSNCGESCSLYAIGHRDADWNATCPPNPKLVEQLRAANRKDNPVFITENDYADDN